MNNLNEIDIIIYSIIFIISLMIASFSLGYLKKISQLYESSNLVAADLDLDAGYVRWIMVDRNLYIKLVITYIVFGVFVYLIQDSYSFYSAKLTYVSLVVFVVYNYLFYKNEIPIDAGDADNIAFRVLNKISNAKRVGRLEDVERLSRIGDYLIVKFDLNKNGDIFESKSYVSEVDKLKDNERLQYKARTFFKRIYFAIAATIPIVLLILVSVFVRQML